MIFVREDREPAGVGSNTVPKEKTNTNSTRKSPVLGPVLGNNRVYVGNLSWDVEWQDLKDHMKRAGNVLYADGKKREIFYIITSLK